MDSRFDVMQLRCDVFLQFLSFSFETTLSAWSNKAAITLCFADVVICTSSIVSKVTKKLIELRDNNLIEQQEYFKLKPTGTQPPRFYGLPKIHKDETPV